jgi:hypothetical protein
MPPALLVICASLPRARDNFQIGGWLYYNSMILFDFLHSIVAQLKDWQPHSRQQSRGNQPVACVVGVVCNQPAILPRRKL